MGRLSIPVLDAAWIRRLNAVSRAQLGLDHLQGGRLAQAVGQLSHAYTRQRDELAQLQGDSSLLSARLQFFLPRDLLKVHGPLAELHSVGALPAGPRWRVLDLGAGLGATTLGVARFAALSRSADVLEVTALDVDPEALSLFEALVMDLGTLPGVPIDLQSRVGDLDALKIGPELGGPFDLIVLGLALNELCRAHRGPEREARLLQRLIDLAGLLAPGGCLLVIEPALRETSRVLHALRDQLVARGRAPYVFAPCLGRAACPMLRRERDFCHERLPCALPAALAELARSAGLRERDLTYSYLTLKPEARSLSELGDVAERLFRAVSGQLKTKGKTEVWLCGSAGAPRAQRLDRHRTEHNARFEAAERGCIIDVSTTSPAAPGALMRVDKNTEVQVLQRWEDARDDGSDAPS